MDTLRILFTLPEAGNEKMQEILENVNGTIRISSRFEQVYLGVFNCPDILEQFE